MIDPVKQAFEKVKDDINFLNNEILDLKILINDLKNTLNNLENTSTDKQTIRHINTTDNVYSTDNSTHYSTVPQEVEGLKTSNLTSSTGNEGVSTDRQTDRQTDRRLENSQFSSISSTHISHENNQKNIESEIQQASEILKSLDTIKKEIRLKFKHLTPQEMAVFSSVYQLEEQEKEVTYKLLSKQLKLSESSIRDYTQRMINKGIPVKKQKINNKKVFLSISSELKKIATLPTIIQLREL